MAERMVMRRVREGEVPPDGAPRLYLLGIADSSVLQVTPDDLAIDGMLHVVFVRSTIAHATLTSIEVDEARQAPGVVGVFTAADIDLAPLAPPSPISARTTYDQGLSAPVDKAPFRTYRKLRNGV